MHVATATIAKHLSSSSQAHVLLSRIKFTLYSVREQGSGRCVGAYWQLLLSLRIATCVALCFNTTHHLSAVNISLSSASLSLNSQTSSSARFFFFAFSFNFFSMSLIIFLASLASSFFLTSILLPDSS